MPEHNWSAYEEALKANPVLAKMMISGVVYSLGDWIAQVPIQSNPIPPRSLTVLLLFHPLSAAAIANSVLLVCVAPAYYSVTKGSPSSSLTGLVCFGLAS
jgi:hypothetical protein